MCGEIMSYEDLKEHGSETAVKAAGKLRQQGKPYESEFPTCLILVLVLNLTDVCVTLLFISGGWRHCVLEVGCLSASVVADVVGRVFSMYRKRKGVY